MTDKTESDYKSMTYNMLRKLCVSRKIKYVKQMSKAKMVEVLEKNDKDPSYTLDPDMKQAFYTRYSNWIKNNEEKYLRYREHNNEQKKMVRKQKKLARSTL